jgi:dTDP-glucose 4,6-dehydratase
MRILVTGGAGFIGSNFVKKVLNQERPWVSSVTVLDKLTYAGHIRNFNEVTSNPKLNFVHGDICDSTLVTSLVNKSDAIVNFAAESHVDHSIISSSEFVKTNVVGIQVLLDAVKSTNKSIRFVQISTDEVYGTIKSGSWTEDSPLLPNSPYASTKAGGELLARAYHRTYGLDIIITRCCNNYGPLQYPEKLIPLFITNLIKGKKVPLYGNGENVREWLHVEDHCQAIIEVLLHGKTGEVYNIGGGEEFTNLEITQLILGLLGADASSIEYVQDRRGHDLRYSLDWSKISRELGFLPQIKFESGIQETVEWYRNNLEWWHSPKNRSS